MHNKKLQYIKELIKSNNLIYKVYKNLRYPKEMKISNVFQKVNRIIKQNKFNQITFDGDNIYCKVYDIEFLYLPDKFGGGLLGGMQNQFEVNEVQFVKNNIKDGDVFIDIGSNFGFYSVFVGKNFPNCIIHSFEPLPETFNIFKKNIKHNRLEGRSITINNCGLADKKGVLYFTNNKYAGNHIVQYPEISDSVTQVNVISLDDSYNFIFY